MSRRPRFALILLVLGVLSAGAGSWMVLREKTPATPTVVESERAASSPRAEASGRKVAAVAQVVEVAQVVPPSSPPEPPVRPPDRSQASASAKPAGATPSRANFGSAWQREARPELAAFSAWAERYRLTPVAARVAMVEEGSALVLVRRGAVKELIKTDPKQAIAAAVPMAVRVQLPAEVVAQLEERVSGAGDLEKLGITPAPGQVVAEPYTKRATVEGKVYRAYTYGRREAQPSKKNTSVQGVAIDGALAVSESPLRLLEVGEAPAANAPVAGVCPVSGNVTPVAPGTPLNTQAQTAVQVAGKVHVLCQPEHVAEYERRLIEQEDAAGPYPVGFTLNDSGSGTSNIAGRPPISWCQGTKKLLFIRVDFPDLQGTPTVPGGSTIDDNFVVNQINQANGIRDFYQQGSYNKTTLQVASAVGGDSPDVTPVYRLPQTASYYAVGDPNDSFDGQMHIDARALATAGGFNLNNYDRIGVVFSNLSGISGSKITYGGRAEVQGEKFWINGYFNFGTMTHELGHTYGLEHSNLWLVNDGNPVSPNGTSLEYGDPFDSMGNNVVTIANHFNHWEKSLMQWIPDAAVTTVSAAGTYRVYRFDHASANLANALALKIVRNGTQDYWIGHRRALSTPALLNGAHIVWGYNTLRQSDLLDFTTPGSNPSDSPLAVGTSYHDTGAGITIHALALGGTSPNEYLDVQVSFDNRVHWSTTTYTVDEKLGPATLTLYRTGNTAGNFSVNYATSNGSATAPADYTSTSGTVTWTNGDSAPKTVSIPIAADAVAEGMESFNVTLSGATAGGIIINGAVATVNIADAGAPDPALNPGWIDNAVEQVVVQPDGAMLVAGWFGAIYVDFTGYTRQGIARLNADGTLDQSYGSGGGVDALPVYALVLQPDGKAVIGGAFATVHGVARTRVARLNADGSVDTTFNPGAGPNDEVHALALQPDGKILIGGKFTSVSGQTRAGIARLNADGTLDATFSSPAFLGFPNADVLSIALQPDNKPLVAGSFYFNPAPYKSGVARLNTDGTLDTTFNPGYGAHVAGNNGFLQTVQKVAVQQDGKVVVGGYFTGFDNTTRQRVARLNSNGTLDTGFAPTVDPSIPANTSPYPHVRSLLIQADGRIVIGGSFAQVNGVSANKFARLNANGTSDATFAVGAGSTGWVNDLTMQADGKLVLGTDFGSIQGIADRCIARLFSALPGLPGTIQFSAPVYSGEEGNGLTISAMRMNGSFGAVSMNYATQGGTALPARYTPVAGTLSWASGDAAAKTIAVSLLNDGAPQSDQSFSLNLGIPIGGAIAGTPGKATVTIRTPASNVTSTGATLNAAVNPNGVATTAWFEYGTTISYGQTSTPTAIGSGTSEVPFTANLGGLLSSTTYHYRLVVSTAGGTVYYGDQTFMTGVGVPVMPWWAAIAAGGLLLVLCVRRLPVRVS